MKRTLGQFAGETGLSLTEKMLETFEIYQKLLVEWNGKMNLTAIVEPEEIAVKHFLDSLMVLRVCQIQEGASLVDVGTGAGFPGVPLKIARPDLHLTLLDSLRKRTAFLQALSLALGQEDNRVIHRRAEDCGSASPLRESFDFATARAVAALPALCEYCLPYVKVGGCFLALKGPDVEEEAAAAQRAMGELGAQLERVERFSLPGGHARSVVILRKISQTPSKYPRSFVKITKTPL